LGRQRETQRPDSAAPAVDASDPFAPYEPPAVFGKRLPDGADGAARQLRQMMLGPALSGSMPHFHTPAVNTLVVGEKLWMLAPPSHAEFSSARAAEWFRDVFPTRYAGTQGSCGCEDAGGTAAAAVVSADGAAAPASVGGGVNNNNTTMAVGAASDGCAAEPQQQPACTPHVLLQQAAGDVLYVPEHWGHAVLNAMDSFALAIE
jgi:hypothetical protein